jgi:AraC-like DNA-binding protein
MKYYRAEMGGIEPWLWHFNGDLPEHRRQWTQQPDHWTLFFLEHTGGFSLNNHTLPYGDGFVALVAPGTKAGFVRVGENTHHYSLTFGLSKRTETVALPSLTDLGDLREVRRKEFQDADRWLHISIGRGLSCVYNLLWSIAQPADILRSNDLMYDFERLVTRRLSEKLTVASLAAELNISQSQLLRSVQAEYNQTAQQFIREKRAEIAKTLIVTTDLPLKTIASQTGMADLQYFNKMIHSTSGLSPRALRELAVNRTNH